MPLSVAISDKSLKSPRWPIRNTLPATLASPIPSDMLKCSSTTLRKRSASCPGGISTAEENVRAGGFGEAVLDLLSDNGLATAFLATLTMPDLIVDHGPQATMRRMYGVDATGIARTAQEALEGRRGPVARAAGRRDIGREGLIDGLRKRCRAPWGRGGARGRLLPPPAQGAALADLERGAERRVFAGGVKPGVGHRDVDRDALPVAVEVEPLGAGGERAAHLDLVLVPGPHDDRAEGALDRDLAPGRSRPTALDLDLSLHGGGEEGRERNGEQHQPRDDGLLGAHRCLRHTLTTGTPDG